MPDSPNAAEIETLQRKLDASRGLPGFADRVKAIEARLKELQDGE